jgi:hypothetical protein
MCFYILRALYSVSFLKGNKGVLEGIKRASRRGAVFKTGSSLGAACTRVKQNCPVIDGRWQNKYGHRVSPESRALNAINFRPSSLFHPLCALSHAGLISYKKPAGEAINRHKTRPPKRAAFSHHQFSSSGCEHGYIKRHLVRDAFGFHVATERY